MIYVYARQNGTKLMVCIYFCVHIHLFIYNSVFMPCKKKKINLITINKFSDNELLMTLFS